eukprot:SAG11_NODE_769_length_7262_cov_20.934385_9_plen_102_part_00
MADTLLAARALRGAGSLLLRDPEGRAAARADVCLAAVPLLLLQDLRPPHGRNHPLPGHRRHHQKGAAAAKPARASPRVTSGRRSAAERSAARQVAPASVAQ